MHTESFFLQSDFDGARLAVTTVCHESPRFCFQITHGMAEHRMRYIPFMEYIASLGGACIVSDMRGHGETSDPADYGYFGVDGVEATLSDLHQIGGVIRIVTGICFLFAGICNMLAWRKLSRNDDSGQKNH